MWLVINVYKVGVYIRLSKEEYNEEKASNSVINQKQLISEYIKKKDDLEFIDYYIDDGYSGTNFDRPAFKELLKDITNKKINTVIVKDLSRLGRNHIEVDNYLENIFPVYNVRFISIGDNIDSLNYSNDDNIIVPIKSLINGLYAKDISIKVKTALDAKRKNGEFIGSFAPYGYTKDENNNLIIDKESAYNVKIIFRMFLNGKSRKEIVDELNNRNILIPKYYRKSSNEMIMSKWNTDIINRLLRNETYIGMLIQGKKRKLSYRSSKIIDVNKDEWIVVPNHHQAIISKEDFEKVQVLLKKTTRVNKDNQIDLFSGYLKCADCGKELTIRKSKNLIYYYCSYYVRNKECTSHSINKVKLEELVKKEISKKKKVEDLNRSLISDMIDNIYVKENKQIDIKFKERNW